MSEKQKNLTKVYISLDCLLDTRLGVMALIDTDFCYDVTTSKEYFTREHDLFKSEKMGTLSKATFDLVAKSSGTELIRNSLKTKIHIFVRQICTQLFFQAMSSPFHSGVELDVNLYPYEFSPEEELAILKAISLTLGKEFSVNLINKSNTQLDAEYVRENYRCMIMYHYYDWMNVHELAIKKKPLRETGFYVPKIYFGKQPPTDLQLQEFADHNTDLFLFSQQILAPLVPIQFLPIALFCADTPANKAEYSRL